MADIVIPLGQFTDEKDIPRKTECAKVVRQEYAQRYLKSLGIGAGARSRSLQKLVLRHAPLVECTIEAGWGDGSVAADHLFIRQPQTAMLRAAELKAAEEEEENRQRLNETNIAQSRVGHTGFIKPLLEEVNRADAMEIPKVGSISPRFHRGAEWLPSSETDKELTEELERVRMQGRRQAAMARGGGGSSSSSADAGVAYHPPAEVLGPLGEARLEELKRKYVLPFACERSSFAGGYSLEPWQSMELTPLEVPDRFLDEVLTPVSASMEEISSKCKSLAKGSLPLELLTQRRTAAPGLMVSTRARLLCGETARLAGLLTHFVYWNLLGHLHPPKKRLPDAKRQDLVISIHELWSSLTLPHQDSAVGAGFVIPALLLAVKMVVEMIMSDQYQDVFRGSALARLVDEINVTCMNLLDPDCLFSRFGALDTRPEAIRLWRKL